MTPRLLGIGMDTESAIAERADAALIIMEGAETLRHRG
jgi:hypothetical protein